MGYQVYDKQRNQVLRNTILNDMYHIIGQSVTRGWYAFKGGYILGKAVNGVRHTTDLDVTILNSETFELATHPLVEYLDRLVQIGAIWNYTIKMPVVTEDRNMSGGIKVYIKSDANTPKRVLCGIDMSIHPLGEGVELSAEGYCQYSKELMLADKVSALYNTEKSVLRRIRDILDIYLILLISDRNLNKKLILERLKGRGTNIQKYSTLEKMFYSESKIIYQTLLGCISDGERMDQNFIQCSNVTPKVILDKVFLFLSKLRED